MSPTQRDPLTAAIPEGQSLLLDSSALLAYLSRERTTAVAAAVLDGRVRTGRNPAWFSTVTLAESLVRPYRAGRERAAEVADALLRFPNLEMLDVTAAVAREAARIRASTGIPLPDALILATAVVNRIDIVVANDARWSTVIERGRLPVALVHLEGLTP